MTRLRWTTWRRDLLIGALAAALTASVLVPLGWGAVRGGQDRIDSERARARAAALLAAQKTAEAEQQRALAQRALLDLAADFAGFRDRTDAEVMGVTTNAVAPEIPEGAHLLLDKKATAFAVGDIVIYRVEGKNYLGRVVALDRAPADGLTVGRNGEPNRHVVRSAVAGRAVLNTR